MSYLLKVSRDELWDSLRPMVKAYKASEVGHMELSYMGGHLFIDAGRTGTRVPAEGKWPATVTVSNRGQFMRAIKYLAHSERRFVFVAASETSVTIDGHHVGCYNISTEPVGDTASLDSTAQLPLIPTPSPTLGSSPKVIDENRGVSTGAATERTVTFKIEKETKSTVRYEEVPAEGQPPIIGTLYVQKWFAGNATELQVTVKKL